MDLKCPGLTIHKYHEDEDITECYQLNPDLIEYISIQGWVILEKLAEGGISDVFRSKQNRTEAVMIIFGNVGYNNMDIRSKLKLARKFPNIFPFIYDSFNTDIPYSLHPKYLANSGNFASRTIQVIEKLDMTLDKYLVSLSPKQKDIFVVELRALLINYLTVLVNYGIYYTDLKLENIGVIITDIVYIKLLDIEGIHTEARFRFDPVEAVEALIKWEING